MSRQRLWLVVVDMLLVQASLVSAAEPLFLGRTRQDWVDQLDSGQRRLRAPAAWAIQQFALDEINRENELVWLNELLLLTESNSSTARYWGTVGLGRMIDKLPAESPARTTAFKALPTLLEDGSPAVRIAAADALLSAPDRTSALAVLVELLAHPQEAVRIQAVTALERWGDDARPAAGALQKATIDASEYVKRISSRSLAKLAAPSP
jgi:HEAT repeat protein